MSSRELDEQNERTGQARLAEALGISVDELDKLEVRIEDNRSKDDLLYGHMVYFEEGSDPAVLKKYGWSVDGDCVDIHPMVD